MQHFRGNSHICHVAILFIINSTVIRAAHSGEPKRVAVLPVECPVALQHLSPPLTAIIGVELAKTGQVEVISPSDIDSLLRFERQRALLGCAQEPCGGVTGDALGVDYLVTTHLTVLGGHSFVEMVLIDTARAVARARVYRRLQDVPENIVGAIQQALRDLIDRGELAAEFNPRPRLTGSPPTPIESAATSSHLGAWLAAGSGVAIMVGGGVVRYQGTSKAAATTERSTQRLRRTGEAVLAVGAAVTLGGLFALGLDAGDSPALVATTQTCGGHGTVTCMVAQVRF